MRSRACSRSTSGPTVRDAQPPTWSAASSSGAAPSTSTRSTTASRTPSSTITAAWTCSSLNRARSSRTVVQQRLSSTSVSMASATVSAGARLVSRGPAASCRAASAGVPPHGPADPRGEGRVPAGRSPGTWEGDRPADGREAVLAPGDFVLHESDRDFRWRLEQDGELLVLTWPRACVRIPDTLSRVLTARCLSGGEGLGAIVGRMLHDLVSTPPELTVDGCLRLADEVLDLVTTVAQEQVRPAAEPVRSTDGLLRRIDTCLSEHVSDLDLAPTAVAAAHFISTRHLHRLFASRGTTVSQQVLRLRLERARLELRQPSCRDRSITDVARQSGFSDLATFSRAFRTAYGTTPTQYRFEGAR